MIIRLSVIAMSLALLSGCALMGTSPLARQGFSERQGQAAQAAADEGRLLEALALWQTVAAVTPKNADARARITALEAQIDAATREAIDSGQKAYASGARKEGDRWMLRALALSPQQPEALQALRLSVSEASHNRQKEKVESAYAGIEDKRVAPEPEIAAQATQTDTLAAALARLHLAGDYEGVLATVEGKPPQELSKISLSWLRKTHIALAARSRDEDQPEQQLMHLDKALAIASLPGGKLQQERQKVAETLSDSYYRESLTLFKQDLDAAIVALRTAITFNPANIAAVEKLDQAQTLKRNLKRIQGGE